MMKIQLYLLVLSAVVCSVSCNSVKRVLNDETKLEKVGREWEKKNPCNNDTLVISKSDTTIMLDTLYKIYNDTLRVDGKVVTLIKKVPVEVTKIIRIRDTVNVYTVDNRRLNIALDSIVYYKYRAAKYEENFNKIEAKTKDVFETFIWFAKAFFKKTWWLLLLLLAAFFGYKWLKSKYTLPF